MSWIFFILSNGKTKYQIADLKLQYTYNIESSLSKNFECPKFTRSLYFGYSGFITISRSEPFISSWMVIRSQTTGPFVVQHYLGEYPAKVDVQLNVTKDGEEYIFSGIGTAQREDDRDTMYGGVVYRYNDQHVKLYVPKSTGINSYTTKGRLVYTGN